MHTLYSGLLYTYDVYMSIYNSRVPELSSGFCLGRFVVEYYCSETITAQACLGYRHALLYGAHLYMYLLTHGYSYTSAIVFGKCTLFNTQSTGLTSGHGVSDVGLYLSSPTLQVLQLVLETTQFTANVLIPCQ